jgi:hypothetical protein
LGDEVGYSNSEQNTVLFDEQRMNVAYFLNDLRGWNGTSLVLFTISARLVVEMMQQGW